MLKYPDPSEEVRVALERATALSKSSKLIVDSSALGREARRHLEMVTAAFKLPITADDLNVLELFLNTGLGGEALLGLDVDS